MAVAEKHFEKNSTAIVVGAKHGWPHAYSPISSSKSVTVLDRDALPDGAESRTGLPEAKHVHAV
jgi:hypothetical protein